MKHGEGTLTLRDGTVYQQVWEEDTLISEKMIVNGKDKVDEENDVDMKRKNFRRREQKDGITV